MYNVLIVDDEQPVLDGIQLVIHRSFDIFTVAATARSGREAIEKAASVRPELILMDVKMPGMSGLDAIREIRRFLPETIFILVTAYERFDIAKEAFDLGVAEYLLKPVTKERLIEVLTKASRKLADALPVTNTHTHTNMEEARVLLEPVFFRTVLDREIQDSKSGNKQIESLKKVLEITQTSGRAFIVEGPEAGTHADRMREALRFKAKALVYAENKRRLLIYIPGPEAEDSRNILSVISAELDKNGSVTEEKTGDMNLSDAKKPELPGGYRIAEGKMHQIEQADRSFAEAEAVLMRTGEHEEEAYPFAAERDVVEALLFRSEYDFLQGLRAFCEDIRYQRPAGQLLTDIQELAVILFHALGQRMPEAVGRLVVPDIRGTGSVGQAEEALFGFAKQLCALRGESREKELSPVVSRALEYLRQNFGSSISLEDTALAAGVSPQYLSRVFSEEMHESFIDYLTRIRMQRARQLLREGASIKAISQDLGYTDPNYFSRLFKKVTGLTPKEFART